MQACVIVALVLLAVVVLGCGTLGGAKACMSCARGVPYKAYGTGPRVARMLPKGAGPTLRQAVRRGAPGRSNHRVENVHVSVVTDKAVVESTYHGDTYNQILRALPGWARRRAKKLPHKGAGMWRGKRRNIDYTLHVKGPKAASGGRKWSFDLKFGQRTNSDRQA